MLACFNWKWNFAQSFLEFYHFRVLGSGRTLTAIARQHVAYFLKAALQILALGLLTTYTDNSNFFFYKPELVRFSPSTITLV